MCILVCILVCVHWLNYALHCSAVKGTVLCSVVTVSVVSSIVYSAVQCIDCYAENTLQLLLLLPLLLPHLLLLRHKLGWSCSNLVIVDPRRDEQNFSSLLPHLQSQGGVRQKICRKAFGVFTSKVCNSSFSSWSNNQSSSTFTFTLRPFSRAKLSLVLFHNCLPKFKHDMAEQESR